MEMVLEVLNSPAVSVAIASLVVYLLNRLYAKKPAWKKYEGTVISAIKYAEKAIPDGTTNKSAARLDTALKYALNVIEIREKRVLTDIEKAEIVEGIQVTHDRMEA
jgi:hypothetical protein